jgi:hypothetical protein
MKELSLTLSINENGKLINNSGYEIKKLRYATIYSVVLQDWEHVLFI